MDKRIMTFTIYIDKEDISRIEGPYGGVRFIPFHGEVVSPIFTGKIQPGACDVQTDNLAQVTYMCARYLFEGTDEDGKPCKLYVQNEGWKNPANKNDSVFQAVPTFITDSPKLGAYLCQRRFRSEVSGTGPSGLEIFIYDTQVEV